MKLDSFTRAYIEAALWSSNDESDERGGEPMDKNYGIEDIHEETLKKMKSDCDEFQTAYYDLIGHDLERAGHDFFLTRAGAGCGFWDGGWDEPDATTLTEASKGFGEFTLYVGDDGMIHGMRG